LQLGTIYNPILYGLGTTNSIEGRHSSYGPTNFDTTHNFTADFLYFTPAFHQSLLRYTASGWKVGRKVYLKSGRPFSVADTGIATANVFSSSFSGKCARRCHRRFRHR
jgi:hypothetical protein